MVLAAGGSTRLPAGEGRPKQLLRLPRDGVTLLRHAAQAALEARCGPVVVVLGAQARDLKPELDGLAIQIVENPRWREGMSTSIREGLAALERAGVEAALFTTCDQPKVDGALLRRLVQRFAARPAPPAVACRYAGTLGVPALFGREAFGRLRTLTGDQGAKPVLEHYADRVVSVPFEDAALDLDTPDDLRRLSGPH